MNQSIKHIRKRKSLSHYLTLLLFLGPALLGFIIFKYITSIQAIVYSFFSYSANDYIDPPGVFVFLDNYLTIFRSAEFYRQLKNTVILFLYGILFGFWVPILQALLLNETTKGKGVLRYLYILPAAVPSVAGLAIWRYMWNPDSGLANTLIGLFGISPQTWLLDEKLIKLTLRLPGLLGGGIGMLIYLVAINNVGEEMYEAAKIDGASNFRCMWSITIPNIRGIIGIQFLLSLSGSLLAFDDVYIMTGATGGPGGSAATLVFGIYMRAYDQLQYGQAMAMSCIVLVLTLILVGIQMKLSKARD